mmetsp:Transcript_27170/g.84521  ORF Transcript_27170/g.84521 Transcript_27170/m.84521 type:complete len:1158 (-) Transcript_27170:109-3582(-)
MRRRLPRESESIYNRETGPTRRKTQPVLSAPELRNRVANLPPLVSPHWRAPGGQREPNGVPPRVCSDDLQEAAMRGDLGLVRRLIQAGASVNAPIRALGDDEYMTLPHMLSSKPQIPNGTRILAEIVESTANPNARSSLGCTPLMLACLQKNVGAAEVLLGCGAHLDPVDDHGRTALRCCMILDPEKPSETLSSEIARLIADYQANLDEGGSIPPITEAVLQGNTQGVEVLLELGATSDGLHEAVTQAPLNVIKMLVDKEANPFKRDAKGKTVMEAALTRADDDITTMLRDYIGNLERSQHLHLATRRHSEDELIKGRPIDRGKGFIEGRKNNGEDDLSEWGKRHAKVQQTVRHIYKGARFQIFMFAVLLLALYLPDFWVITSATNTEALDWILIVIFGIFILELSLQLIGEWKTYWLSFSFFMDVVGILSVPLDHSLVTTMLMNSVSLEGATLARATKIVKLGVRSVRFSRLVKLIRFLPDSGRNAVGSTAKKMSAILGKKVSIQVSCLIIVTVILLPTMDLFTFPTDDHSMLAWTTLIDRAARLHPGDLAKLLADFETFFGQLSYFPYEVHCTNAAGIVQVVTLSDMVPARKQDRFSMKKKAPDGSLSAEVFFNFTQPNRVDSITNCLLITAIILIMFTSASLVTHSVGKIVLLPLERLLSVVQSIAGHIFSSVKKMCGRLNDEDEDEDWGSVDEGGTGFADETKLIAKVLKKLAALSEITARRMPIDDFEHLDEDHRALLQDFTVAHVTEATQEATPEGRVQGCFEHMEWAWKQLEDEGIPREAIERWDFHVPEITEKQRLTLCTGLLLMCGGPTVHGSSTTRSSVGMESIARCRSFTEAVSKSHGSPTDVKFHNWMHAADITYTLYRCLNMVKAEHFFGTHERFALIVSAMSHDMGHPGYNNAFLIETSHELAIRYNDNSPLENMHCARLFEIVSHAGTNVFVNLRPQQYRDVRQVCVESILHTDNQRHYTILSELQVTYETEADLFDAVADCYDKTPGEYPPSDAIDFYCTPDVRKLIRRFFLHFVDLSNAMKPWRLCKFWAELVFEEFFRQGDDELSMGLPVQALNDREKVNKAQVQVGFTEFFVLPLASAAARWMPPLRICEDYVRENLERWMRKWFDSEPEREEQERFRSKRSSSRLPSQLASSKVGGW